MSNIRVGNAPCSWGSLEFDKLGGEPIGYEQMLDELVETGYRGTELGDWGYMPTKPARLFAALSSRDIFLLGAFLPVNLRDADDFPHGCDEAIKVARLLASVAEIGAYK